jgi:hypothetical protein
MLDVRVPPRFNVAHAHRLRVIRIDEEKGFRADWRASLLPGRLPLALASVGLQLHLGELRGRPDISPWALCQAHRSAAVFFRSSIWDY